MKYMLADYDVIDFADLDEALEVTFRVGAG